MFCQKCGVQQSVEAKYCLNCGISYHQAQPTYIRENVVSSLCYLFGWVTGLIFFFAYPSNKTIRFHALQSILLQIVTTPFIVVMVAVIFLSIVGVIDIAYMLFFIIGLSHNLLLQILFIVLMVVAYKGKRWRLPIIGNVADNLN